MRKWKFVSFISSWLAAATALGQWTNAGGGGGTCSFADSARAASIADSAKAAPTFLTDSTWVKATADTMIVNDSLNVDNGTLMVGPTSSTVGIGTTVAPELLSLEGTNPTIFLMETSDAGIKLRYDDAGNRLDIVARNSGADSPVMTVKRSGLVGVGTSAPQHLLSSYTSSPSWVLTDTDYNKDVSTAAQAEDTSSIYIGFSSGTPSMYLRNPKGNLGKITMGNYGFYIGPSAGGPLYFVVDGANKLLISPSQMYPYTDSGVSLGRNIYRFSSAYISGTGLYVSDEATISGADSSVRLYVSPSGNGVIASMANDGDNVQIWHDGSVGKAISSSGNLQLGGAGTVSINISPTSLYPAGDNQRSLGLTTSRFAAGYFGGNGIYVSSEATIAGADSSVIVNVQGGHGIVELHAYDGDYIKVWHNGFSARIQVSSGDLILDAPGSVRPLNDQVSSLGGAAHKWLYAYINYPTIANTAAAPTAASGRMYFQGLDDSDADTLWVHNGTSWKAFPSSEALATKEGSFAFGIIDTVKVGDVLGSVLVPNDITLLKVFGHTDAGTASIMLEERAFGSPNSAGSQLLSSDFIVDDDADSLGSFADDQVAARSWLRVYVTAVGGSPNPRQVFVTVLYREE